MSAYRDDLEALQARRAALAGELLARRRELRTVDRLLADARSRGEGPALDERGRGLDIAGAQARRHRRRVVMLRAAALLAAAGAMIAIGAGQRPARGPVTTDDEAAAAETRRAEHERAVRMWHQPADEPAGVRDEAGAIPPGGAMAGVARR